MLVDWKPTCHYQVLTEEKLDEIGAWLVQSLLMSLTCLKEETGTMALQHESCAFTAGYDSVARLIFCNWHLGIFKN